MLYGKLINNEIVYAPDTYISSVITIENFNKDEKLMKEFGYKKVVTDGYDPNDFVTVDNIEERDTVIIIHRELNTSPEVLQQLKQDKLIKVQEEYNASLEKQVIEFSTKDMTKKYSITSSFRADLASAISTFLIHSIDSLFVAILGGKIASLTDIGNFFESSSSILFLGETWKYSELKEIKTHMDCVINEIVEWKQKTEKAIQNANDQIELYRINI